MVLQLKRGYLDASYFRQKFGADIIEQWQEAWQGHARDGMLELSPGRVDLTRKGLLQVDRLLPAFFEPAFQNVRYT
jgi:oxygen-independent coproporphyrinogen-3 oxidase